MVLIGGAGAVHLASIDNDMMSPYGLLWFVELPPWRKYGWRGDVRKLDGEAKSGAVSVKCGLLVGQFHILK